MEITNLVAECLTSLDKVQEIKARLTVEGQEDQPALEEFESSLEDAVSDLLSERLLADVAKTLAEGERPAAEFSDEQLLADCQEEALASGPSGDWNEETARLALASYLKKGGEVHPADEALDTACTLGELFGLEESDELYSVEASLTARQRRALPDSAFCGPNRSFPAHDRAHAVAALRLFSRYKGPGNREAIKRCIERRAAKFGVGFKRQENVAYCPIVVSIEKDAPGYYFPFMLESREEAEEALKALPEVAKAYLLVGEALDAVRTFIEGVVEHAEKLFGEAPLFEGSNDLPPAVELGEEFVLSYFIRHEFLEQAALAKLVGLVRKHGVSLETVESAGKAYSLFGTSVLKRLLTAPVPNAEACKPGSEAPGTNESIEEAPAPKIESVPNPIPEAPSEERKESEAESAEESVVGFFHVRTPAAKTVNRTHRR